MKITNKLFAVMSAAFLLASCNNFTGSDFSKNTKDYYSNQDLAGEYGYINQIDNGITPPFTVDNLPTPTSTANGAKYDYKAVIEFSDAVNPETISGIKVEKMTAGAAANKPVVYTTVASTAKISEDVPYKVDVTFSLDSNTEPYAITVPNTVKAICGMSLDQDTDGVWGEQEDAYYDSFNAAGLVGIEKYYDFNLELFFTSYMSMDFKDPNGADADKGKFVVSIKLLDIMTDGLNFKEFLPGFENELSSHTGIRLLYDDGTYSGILPLSFGAPVKNAADTEYKATYFSGDYQNVDSVELYVKDADTWVIKDYCGTGLNCKYSLNNDKKPQKNIKIDSVPVNPWIARVSPTSPVTFKDAETALTLAGTIPAGIKSLKVLCTAVADNDHDGKDVYENLAVKYQKGLDGLKPVYSDAIAMTRDDSFKNSVIYTCDITLDATIIQNITDYDLFVLGEEGDKASFQVWYKQY